MTPKWDLESFKTAFIYVTLGGIWIGVSGQIMDALLDGVLTPSQIQAVSAGILVLVSGGVLYVMSSMRRDEEEQTRELHNRTDKTQEIQVLNRVLRHNLRNDLNIILGYSEMLKDLSSFSEEEGEESIDTIKQTADKLVNISEKARKLEQISRYTEDETKSIDIVEVIEKEVEEFQERYPEIDISTDLPESRYVFTYDLIDSAIHNLLENSVEHNQVGKPSISISMKETPDGSELCISDNGPGIPEHELEVIKKGEEKPLKHSSGIGLWIVNLVVAKS
ncbi:MAG: HAMP domain-containing sensor histidine kinase, partial [Halobacteria archaeon]|nr:HAMP domain-containing sensor histidine kinase [Halobacteria archaeon]